MLVNKIFISGKLGRDPEMNYTTGGKAYTRLSINTGGNQGFWIEIVCWEQLAEKTATNFFKGNEVFVEGRLQIESYSDKSGQSKTATKIVASMIQATQYKQNNAVVVESIPSNDNPF